MADDPTESSTAQQQPGPTPTPSRQVPFREDCWTEEATSTLVDAWGKRYVELNRGNLRQKDWQEVADAVNSLHGQTKKTRRTDVQCKNRIDTLKKKYKTEKAKISESGGTLTSSWPFFSKLEFLIGSGHSTKAQAKPTPSVAMPLMMSKVPSPSSSLALVQITTTPPPSMYSPPMAVPLPYRKPMMPIMTSPMTPAMYSTPMVMPQKRPAPSPGPEESYFRRNYSAVAAAAAAAAAEDGNEVSDDDDDEDDANNEDRVKAEDDDDEVEGGRNGRNIGMRQLAKAIERFAEIYEKVEGMKQRQMIELEKQRMQFAKDLEVQRMQMFTDTQVQLEKMKRVKRSASPDSNDKS